MLLEENQIAFHSEDGLIFDGVKDYSRQIAEMIGLGSDYEFLQAGVSHICILQNFVVTLCSTIGFQRARVYLLLVHLPIVFKQKGLQSDVEMSCGLR